MGFNQLASATVVIGATTSLFEKALISVKRKLEDLISTKTNISFGPIGEGISAGIESAIKAGVRAMTSFATASFDAAKGAASLEMEMHRNREIFGQMFPMVDATINKLAKTFFYSRAKLADLNANLGLMFVGMGLGTRSVAALSSRFMELGVQASALYGTTLEEFMHRLDSAIAGGAKAFKHMGINIQENQVAMRKWVLASQGAIWWTEEQGTQMARTSLYLDALSNKSGQANWAQQQLGGTLRETSGRFNELWIALGEITKPIWTAAITLLNQAFKSLQDTVEKNKNSWISWGNAAADQIMKLVFYWQAHPLYIQKSQVKIAGYLEEMAITIGWLQDFINTMAKNSGTTLVAWFKWGFDTITKLAINVYDNITAVLANFGDANARIATNIAALFMDALGIIEYGFIFVINRITTVLSNWADEFKQFFGGIVQALEDMGAAAKGTARAFWEMRIPQINMEGDNFFQKQANALREFAGMIPDINRKLQGPQGLMAPPGVQGKAIPVFPDLEFAKARAKNAAEVKKIQDEIDKRRAEWEAKNKGKAGGKESLGPGMQMPIVGAAGGVEGGRFVGIAEFAKTIQQGALGPQAAAIATARNTQRIAEMIEIFGPRLMEFGMPGFAVGPM